VSGAPTYLRNWLPYRAGTVLRPVRLPSGVDFQLPTSRMPKGWSHGLSNRDLVAGMCLDSMWLDARVDQSPEDEGAYLIPWEVVFEATRTERRMLGIHEPEDVALSIEPDENILSGRPLIATLKI